MGFYSDLINCINLYNFNVYDYMNLFKHEKYDLKDAAVIHLKIKQTDNWLMNVISHFAF